MTRGVGVNEGTGSSAATALNVASLGTRHEGEQRQQELVELRATLAEAQMALSRAERLLGMLAPNLPGTPQTDDWITTDIAAKRSGKSQDTIIRWCQIYGIGECVAKRWRVSSSKLTAFLRDHTKKA